MHGQIPAFLQASDMNLRNNENAFSLIESAIVLGVVGLVIGGIWVAANSVRQHYQTNRMASAIATMVVQGRNVLGRTWPGTSTVISTAMIRAGVIPADLIDSTGTVARAPWGDTIGMVQQVNTPSGYDTLSISIRYTRKSDCNNTIAKVIYRFRDSSDLVYLHVGSDSGANWGGFMPFTTSPNCPDGPGVFVLFFQRAGNN